MQLEEYTQRAKIARLLDRGLVLGKRHLTMIQREEALIRLLAERVDTQMSYLVFLERLNIRLAQV